MPSVGDGLDGTHLCRFLQPRASIIEVHCFRPPRPNGIPMAAAAVSRGSRGAEGVEGNVHASRAWKGNDSQRASAAPASFFPRTFKERFSLFAIRSSPVARSVTAALAKSEEREATSECSSTTNTAAASAICVSPSPTAATTSASTAARASDGPQFPELPIADYLRMARVFVGLGITKVRLTGGEPLLRKGLVEMVRELGRHAHRGRPAARHRHHHQRPSAGRVGAAAGRRRPVARDRFDGRGRSASASPASRACRTATNACWPECAPRNAPASAR